MEPENPPPPQPESTGGDLRFFFAGERTMLAWIRTSVSLMALGFVVARFGLFLREMAVAGAALRGENDAAAKLPPAGPSTLPSLWIGLTLIIAGVVLAAVAGRQHARFRKRWRAGLPYEVPAVSAALILGALLAVMGMLMAVYLLIAARS